MARVLVVDDKQVMRDSVGATLSRAGFQVSVACDGAEALKSIARQRPDAVITDLMMPGIDGVELLQKIGRVDDQLPVVLMTAYGSVGSAVDAMKHGAFDFIQKPFEGDQLEAAVARAVEHHRLLRENAVLKSQQSEQPAAAGQDTGQATGPALVGQSAIMRRLSRTIDQVAQSQATVLIHGESGTGKEVVARCLHARGARRDKPMLAVNCAALSSSLLESELFGHEKGAFTGADQRRKGRFELADGGTLLLDEISEISPELQAKLLRVLQERQFERVGSSVSIGVDVRVVATTNRDLPAEVAAGRFRQDLYYRLNVVPMLLPALRERREDIALLAEHFLGRVASREGGEPKRFDGQSLRVLEQYDWPGNVRELQNICERASVLAPDQVIGQAVIESWLDPKAAALLNGAAVTDGRGAGEAGHRPEIEGIDGVGGMAMASAGGVAMAEIGDPIEDQSVSAAPGEPRVTMKLADLEREQIVRTLRRFGGNRQRTAKALGIGVRTLGLKLKKWKEQKLVPATL